MTRPIPSDAHPGKVCKFRPTRWMRKCWLCDDYGFGVPEGERSDPIIREFRNLGKGG